MSCNCRNSFERYLPGNHKPVSERPKVKIIKKSSTDQEPKKEENKNEELL